MASFWVWRVPLYIGNSFWACSTCFIFFVTTVLTGVNLVLCNHLYRVDLYNSYKSCVHKIICKSRASFYVLLIFYTCQCGDFPPFVHSFSINTGYDLWCELKARYLNHELRYNLETSPKAWFSESCLSYPDRKVRYHVMDPVLGMWYNSLLLKFFSCFSLFLVAAGKST